MILAQIMASFLRLVRINFENVLENYGVCIIYPTIDCGISEYVGGPGIVVQIMEDEALILGHNDDRSSSSLDRLSSSLG